MTASIGRQVSHKKVVINFTCRNIKASLTDVVSVLRPEIMETNHKIWHRGI